jgi:hypothetical protein
LFLYTDYKYNFEQQQIFLYKFVQKYVHVCYINDFNAIYTIIITNDINYNSDLLSL